MEDLQNQAVQVLGTLGIALLNLGVAYLLYYIKKATEKAKIETQKLQDEAKIQLINNAIDRVNKLATDSVKATESIVAKELRQSVADGKVDKAELYKLGTQVSKDIYNQLSEDTKNILSEEVKDVQSYINTVVEKTLFDIKNK